MKETRKQMSRKKRRLSNRQKTLLVSWARFLIIRSMKKLTRTSALLSVLLSFSIAAMIERGTPMNVAPFAIAFIVCSAVAFLGMVLKKREKERDKYVLCN